MASADEGKEPQRICTPTHSECALETARGTEVRGKNGEPVAPSQVSHPTQSGNTASEPSTPAQKKAADTSGRDEEVHSPRLPGTWQVEHGLLQCSMNVDDALARLPGKWQVDFTERGKNLWLDMAEDANEKLETALSHGVDTVDFKHQWFETGKKRPNTTEYSVSIKDMVQTSKENGKVRKLRRVVVCKSELLPGGSQPSGICRDSDAASSRCGSDVASRAPQPL